MKPHVGIRFFLQRCIPYGDMLPSYQCLHRHGAVHQPDARVGGVAVDAAVGQDFYAAKHALSNTTTARLKEMLIFAD